jgi:hypothetical protein
MPEDLEKLLEAAKHRLLSDAEREEQRRSFAYGNANIENSNVTRQTVDRAADDLEKQKA